MQTIRPRTVKLISRLLTPLVDEGVIGHNEFTEILSNLKHLALKGAVLPAITPKLIDMDQTAEMLGISLANFKKMEREGKLRFKRKMVGSSVRYLNTDIIKFITESESASIATENIESAIPE